MALSPQNLTRAGCLEPTYEGLKLQIVRTEGSVGTGLEPTYEGLKHGRKMVGFREINCLEPSYEGLKHLAEPDHLAPIN